MLKIDIIDQFLNEMHNITSVFTYFDRKAFVTPEKVGKPRNFPSKFCRREEHSPSACKSQGFVSTKTKGYLRTNCYKFERKQ